MAPKIQSRAARELDRCSAELEAAHVQLDMLKATFREQSTRHDLEVSRLRQLLDEANITIPKSAEPSPGSLHRTALRSAAEAEAEAVALPLASDADAEALIPAATVLATALSSLAADAAPRLPQVISSLAPIESALKCAHARQQRYAVAALALAEALDAQQTDPEPVAASTPGVPPPEPESSRQEHPPASEDSDDPLAALSREASSISVDKQQEPADSDGAAHVTAPFPDAAPSAPSAPSATATALAAVDLSLAELRAAAAPTDSDASASSPQLDAIRDHVLHLLRLLAPSTAPQGHALPLVTSAESCTSLGHCVTAASALSAAVSATVPSLVSSRGAALADKAAAIQKAEAASIAGDAAVRQAAEVQAAAEKEIDAARSAADAAVTAGAAEAEAAVAKAIVTGEEAAAKSQRDLAAYQSQTAALLSQLRERVAQQQCDLEASRRETEAKVAEVASVRQLESAARHAADKSLADAKAARTALVAAETASARITEELATFKELLAQQQVAVATAQGEATEKRNELEAARQEVLSLQAQLEVSRGAADSSARELAIAQQRSDAAETRVRAVLADASGLREALERTEAAATAANARVEEKDAATSGLQAELATAAGTIKSLTASLSAARALTEAVDTARAELASRLDAAVSEAEAARAEAAAQARRHGLERQQLKAELARSVSLSSPGSASTGSSASVHTPEGPFPQSTDAAALRAELEQKNLLISALLQRVEPGAGAALVGPGLEAERSARLQRARTSKKASGILGRFGGSGPSVEQYDRLQCVLEETVLMNQRLQADLKTLGAEMSRISPKPE
jgi:hypothetical protein